jgi:hypothetical protein
MPEVPSISQADAEAVPAVRPRYLTQHRKDTSEPDIREALEKAGFTVFDYLPCDLLCFRPDVGIKTLECKTPTKTGKQRKRKDQKKQDEFLKLTKTPVVLTPEAAIRAIEWPLAEEVD